jgi:hypothetical protein
MIMIARISFNKPNAEGGIAALRAAGYGVLVYGFFGRNIVLIEASRDIEVPHEIQVTLDAEFDRDDIQVELDAEWDRVDAIIGPLYGEIDSIGPLRAGHSPEAQALNQELDEHLKRGGRLS